MENHLFNNGVTIDLNTDIDKGLSYWIDINKRATKEDSTVQSGFGHGTKFSFENIVTISKAHIQYLRRLRTDKDNTPISKSETAKRLKFAERFNGIGKKFLSTQIQLKEVLRRIGISDNEYRARLKNSYLWKESEIVEIKSLGIDI